MSDDLRALRDAFPERPPTSASRAEARAALQATMTRRRPLVRVFVIGGLATASVGGLVLAIAMHRTGDPTVRIELGVGAPLPAGSAPKLSTDRSRKIIAPRLPISQAGRRTLRQTVVVDSDRGRYILWTWRDADVSSKFGAMVGMTGPTNIGGDAGPCALQQRQLRVCSTIAVSQSGPPVVSGMASANVATLRGRAEDGADVPIVRRGQFWVAVPALDGTPDAARPSLRQLVGFDAAGGEVARLDVGKRLSSFKVIQVDTPAGQVYARGGVAANLTYLAESDQFIYLISRSVSEPTRVLADCLTIAERASGAVVGGSCEEISDGENQGGLAVLAQNQSVLLLPDNPWAAATVDGKAVPLVGGRIVEFELTGKPVNVRAVRSGHSFGRRIYPPGTVDPAQQRRARRTLAIPTMDGPIRVRASTFDTVRRSSLHYRGSVDGIAIFSGKVTNPDPTQNDDCFVYVELRSGASGGGSIGCGLKSGIRGGSGYGQTQYSASGRARVTIVQTMPRGPFVSATIDGKPLPLGGRETYVIRGKPGDRHEIRAVRPDGTVFRRKLRLGRP